MIKLIATDMDNTMLDKNGELSDDTLSTIKKAKIKGVDITLVTGRTYNSASKFANKIGTNIPIICYNGALIKTAKSGDTLFSDYIDDEVLSEMLLFAYDNNIYIHLYDDDIVVVDKLDLSKHNDPDLKFTSYREVGDLRGISIRTPKVLLALNPKFVPETQAILEEKFKERCYFAQSEAHLIEVMSTNINKGTALAELSKLLGIKKDDIIGIGDNTNDIPLLLEAGIAVSVGNGVKSLKQVADYITKGERELGFIEAVEKFVL